MTQANPLQGLITFLMLGTLGAFAPAPAAGQTTGAAFIDWEKAEITVDVRLDLQAAGVRLPSGRLRGEELLVREYPRILRSLLLGIPVDSSGALSAAIAAGEYSFAALDDLSLEAQKTVPALSGDLRFMEARYTLSLDALTTALITHRKAAELPRLLSPVPAEDYTSIIVIAAGSLPVHGRRVSAFPVPCLFPKIWDSDMNLIYERNLGRPDNKSRVVRYVTEDEIYRPTPSGLEGSLAEFAGERPFRVIARGVFGALPTDLIIDREDALEILSSPTNRRLLRDHKVIFVLPGDVLRDDL